MSSISLTPEVIVSDWLDQAGIVYQREASVIGSERDYSVSYLIDGRLLVEVNGWGYALPCCQGDELLVDASGRDCYFIQGAALKAEPEAAKCNLFRAIARFTLEAQPHVH
jgi:hypothetical protein